ncbi:YicC/YloC family endoribonuclease [Arhodomonas sp. AD133]|uniref:YicC/YloC family endoribonuclease n=1 Tax=Arhodomonas sp. AD133 TaxID=3415009 RepID=UPI003EBF4B61
MIRSMTAFARRDVEGEWGKLSWELRSVNHRYLDVHPRLPEELRFLEGALRERVAGRVGRGKLECTLRYRPAVGVAATLQLNWPYAEQVIEACTRLGERLPESAPVSPLEVLRTPGVMAETDPDLQPVAEAALGLLDEAVTELVRMREGEGARLAEIIRERAREVARLTREVRERRTEVNSEVRERLQKRLDELDVTADPGRLEQELAFIAQRLDVDEELERLLAHVAEVEKTLDRDDPVGRRIDFLMQELNREANTLSSKSNDARTTQAAVEMKVLIEQMREQVQNIE